MQKLYLLRDLLERIVDAVFHLNLIDRQLCVSLHYVVSFKRVRAKKLHREVKEVIFSVEVELCSGCVPVEQDDVLL